jgi:FMN phosphatase YigB (HAD superfamily)
VNGLLLLVDFDGTMYRGDEPVRYYASLIANTLETPGPYLAALERYLAQGPFAARDSADTVEAAALRESVDPWGAAFGLATRCYEVPLDVTEDAFTRCRQWMTKPECEVEVVTPLLDTLTDLRSAVQINIITNSGALGLQPFLVRLGIADRFDEVTAGARKPDGLRRFLQRSLGRDLRERPWRAFSIGDHYRNDIEPAAEIGAGCAYIDRFGRKDGPATASASVAEDLLPVLRAWADDPEGTVNRGTL